MSKIIEVASKEIGYQELPNKVNKFCDWFYGKSVINIPWCFIFICYIYDRVGVPIGKGDFLKGWASVPNGLKHYTATNEITLYPVAGDMVIFDWNGDKKPEHIGLFSRDLGNGTIETVEGNTSDGNPSNGGTVQRKIRSKKLVLAYIHPKILDKLTTT